MTMQDTGRHCSAGFHIWQVCLADPRYYVAFMIKPAIGPAPYLCVVDDYGNLVAA